MTVIWTISRSSRRWQRCAQTAGTTRTRRLAVGDPSSVSAFGTVSNENAIFSLGVEASEGKKDCARVSAFCENQNKLEREFCVNEARKFYFVVQLSRRVHMLVIHAKRH